MPIVDFPRGPMATPEAYPVDQPEDPDIGVVDPTYRANKRKIVPISGTIVLVNRTGDGNA